MEFQTLTFIFGFLPLTLLGYYLLRTTRYANLFILLASAYFYAAAAIWYMAPLLITALLDFFIGQRIAESDREAYRRRLIVISMVANLGFLAVFKYTTWLSGHVTALAAMYGIAIAPLVVPLPPGISFYTFQSMSYTIDIYRKEFRPYRNVVDYLSFVSFFPHLVAGPMMRARDLLPQLARLRPIPSMAQIESALFLILFGLFLKTALADHLGGIVERTERLIPEAGKGAMPPGLGLVYAYAFTFQIYCDFAAYSTIARGVARLFGVELMRNFQTPYFSANPSEFWQRWHISLSTWLRDYLYVPLGGNRGGLALTLRNLLITMFLGGLWHGAGVLFIVWGLYQGLLLVVYRVLPIDQLLTRYFGFAGRIAAVFIFFHLIVIGWIFFRAEPEHVGPIFSSILALPSAWMHHVGTYKQYFDALPTFDAVGVWRALYHYAATWWGTLKGFLLTNWYLTVFGWGTILFAIPAIVTDAIGYRYDTEFGDVYERFPLWLKVAAFLSFFYAIVLLARRQAIEFLYFAF
jgi:D-alanyl-lipoteichoic acid acyltransferase DltB (MBOAT superfamily)